MSASRNSSPKCRTRPARLSTTQVDPATDEFRLLDLEARDLDATREDLQRRHLEQHTARAEERDVVVAFDDDGAELDHRRLGRHLDATDVEGEPELVLQHALDLRDDELDRRLAREELQRAVGEAHDEAEGEERPMASEEAHGPS